MKNLKQNLLNQGKKMSDDLKAGKNIPEEKMQELINKMPENELIDLFNYCMSNE